MVKNHTLAGMREEVENILRSYAGEDLIFAPNPGNGGDALIAAGTLHAFRRFGIRYTPLTPDANLNGRHVFLGGGGNLVPSYSEMREQFAQVDDAERVVLLPHTIRGNVDLIAGWDERFVIFCRDADSFMHVRRSNPNVKTILTHDMAFHLDVDEFLSDDLLVQRAMPAWTVRKQQLGDLWSNMKAQPLAYLFRTDLESTAPLPTSQFDLSMEFLPWLSFEDAELTAWCFLQSLRELSAIQTDRLHVAIGAALCSVQCELHDNIYGKNRAVYQQSLAGRFSNVTMSDEILTGAPSKGIPAFFRPPLPETICMMEPPATREEISLADSIRQEFVLPDQQGPYMVDRVRAFRPLKRANVYVEVGTRDKGNIAWLSKSLAEDALIVDVDLVQIPEAEEKLRTYLKPSQQYHKIEGDSVATLTVAKVKRALGWYQADAIFLDSSHMYDHFLREVDLYLSFLRPGGLLMFSDVLWEGNERGKGKAQAALALDRFTPVYSVFMDLPVHRFLPRESKLDVWGGVGVIIKDQ